MLAFSYQVAQAQVTNTQFIAHYNSASVNSIISGFGLPDGLLEPVSEVDFYRVRYMTTHPNGELIEVSGALCIPSDLDCPLPMASYQHGTIARRIEAPSFSGGESTIGVLFASAGYIVCMPDYIGLGVSQVLHPYVHAESEASASLDMIRATRDLQENLNYVWDEQLFIFGYSQGGHATAALQRMIETTASEEFQITASAPMSGPYDISGVQASVLTSDQVYPTPGYLPYVVLSYQEVYGNIYSDLTDVFLPEYAEIIPNLFNGNVSMGTINNAFPDVPAEMLQPEFIEAYNTDPNHPMRLALAANNTMDWAPQVPTRLFYCDMDDQVDFMNSIVAEEAFIELGSSTVVAQNLGSLDHGDCAGPAFLFGFDFFEQNRVNNCALLKTEEETLQLNIFPNPVENEIQFSEQVNGNITIYNSTGQIVQHLNANGIKNMQMDHLTPGLYYLRLNQSRAIVFIKQ